MTGVSIGRGSISADRRLVVGGRLDARVKIRRGGLAAAGLTGVVR